MKKVCSIILAVMMVVCMIPVTVLPVSAEGETEVTYVDRYWDEDEKKVVEETKTVMAKPLTFVPLYTEIEGGWYYVSGDVSNSDSTLKVTGTPDNPTRIILTDGCTLELDGKGIIVNDGCALIIYGQAEGTGALTATSGVHAAIGGENTAGGTIIINGGTVTAKCKMNCAGIGGGNRGDGGTITINGGTVTATGGSKGAGIGGGSNGAGGTITINGGTVDAGGGSFGAGIGGGQGGAGGEVTINGGKVIATGGSNGAGIGSCYKGAGGTVTISGGTVDAKGGQYGAGIGGGTSGAGGTVTVSGGTVTAKGGSQGAGIGGGQTGAGGTVTISGGTVTATGGIQAAGIGGGRQGEGGTVTISGGTVTATGNNKGAGIGAGNGGQSHGKLDVGYDVIKAGSSAPGDEVKLEAYLNSRSAYIYLHKHTYDCSVASDEYLKSGATYTHGAVYYKSCACGACDKSENAATFVSGDPLSLSDCFILQAVEYGLQVGRQGKIVNDAISTDVGRTIIPLTAEQLGTVGDLITVVGTDGNGEFTLTIDCVYTYFYDVTDGEETKITAEDLDYAAFIIIDQNDKGETVTGCGYYRIYNGEKADDSFMFDVLYPASAPAEPLVFGNEFTNEVIDPNYIIMTDRSTPDAMKELLGRQIGKVSVKEVVRYLMMDYLEAKGLNENDIYQATNKWVNDLSKGTDVDTLILDIDSTFPHTLTAEEYADLKYDLTQGDLVVPMIRVDTIEIPTDGRIELTIGNYRYVGQNDCWTYSPAVGAEEPYGRHYDIIAGYDVVDVIE